MTRGALDLCRAVRENILTFGAAESHDQGRIGLVEGGEGGLARLVSDGGELVEDVGLQRLLLRATGLQTIYFYSFFLELDVSISC